MKKSFLGSLIGISIILSIDSLSRVIISLYNKQDILMFSYSEYTGIWPVLLVAISAFSSFFGAMFALTYGRTKQVFTLILFILFAGLYRYGQIYLLKDTEGFEGLILPIITLILTFLAILLAWRLVRPKKQKTEEVAGEKDESISQSSQKHHHPTGSGGQHNQPQ